MDFKYIDWWAGRDETERKEIKRQIGNNVALWVDRENKTKNGGRITAVIPVYYPI